MRLQIHCWDTGVKGEATLVIFKTNSGRSRINHIIDFGASTSVYYKMNSDDQEYCIPINFRCKRVVNEALKVISNECSSGNYVLDTIITHLHYDHFSLIPCITCKASIRSLYIPAIPLEPRKVYERALYFLTLDFILYRDILKEVFDKVQCINIVFRGCEIRVNDKVRVRILWPPLKLPVINMGSEVLRRFERLSKELQEIIGKDGTLYEALEAKVKVLKAIYERQVKEYLRCKECEPVKVSSEEFSDVFRDRSKGEADELVSRGGRGKLGRLSRIVDKALNNFSLVLQYQYVDQDIVKPLIIIPGDATQEVLNYLDELEPKPDIKNVLFLRGAHHGVCYGEYLKRFYPIITWLSRPDAHSHYHLGYYIHVSHSIPLMPSHLYTARHIRKLKVLFNNISLPKLSYINIEYR
jgi:hypothetical protein